MGSARSLPVLLAAALCACRGPSVQGVHPQLVPPASSFDFGEVPVLNVKSLDIPLQNVGRATLNVMNVAIKEANVPFSVTNSPTVVESGATSPVSVACVPPAEQQYTATLLVTTDDSATPNLSIGLTCTGSTVAVMEIQPTMIDFGRVNEGTSAIRPLTILSSGTADLILNSIGMSSDTPASFSFLGSVNTPASVKIGKQLQLTVKFHAAPGSTTGATGTIELVDTDPKQVDAGVPMTAGLNRAPIPIIADGGTNPSPGQVVPLDGSQSYDPDGDNPLTYQWKLALSPAGSSTQIMDPTAAVTQMTLDPNLPGEYDVTLDVTDAAGAKNLQPAKLILVAVPTEHLLIELFQDRTDTDLDIHFLKTTLASIGDMDDCFYANPNPNWATSGPPDGPLMSVDALSGYGPDVTVYANPIQSTFRLVVGFTSAHLASTHVTTGTVRIYEFGVEKAELSHQLQNEGDFWIAADIDWPSGTITPR